MAQTIHTFDNGVRAYEDHFDRKQRKRYRHRNIHEAEEEDVFIQLIRQLPVDGCFVDIGAGFGYYVILARKLSPGLTIHAVEPLDRQRVFLQQNLRLNGIPECDVIVHSDGVASSEGEESFVDLGYGSCIPRCAEQTRVSLKRRLRQLLEWTGLRERKHYTGEMLRISTTTLDILIGRIGRPVDLLQMDVQGLEVEVLKSGATCMATGSVKSLLIGTHSRQLHQDCVAELVSKGYTIDLDEPNPKEQPDGIIVARQ